MGNWVRSHFVRGYTLSVLSTSLATLLIMQLRPALDRGIMAPFLAAVMTSAWYGGLGPGLLATGLSVMASAYFFLEPTYSLAVHHVDDIAQVIVFSMVAALISVLNTAHKRAQAALMSSEGRMRTLNEGLEQRVQERTEWLSLMYDVSRSANEAQTQHQAILAALKRIGTSGRWPYIQVYLSRADAPECFSLSPLFHAEKRSRFDALRDIVLGFPGKRGHGLTGHVLDSREIQWVSDFRAEPASPAGTAFLDAGLASAVAFPVVSSRDITAVIECFSEQPLERNENLSNLLSALGLELGRVLECKRLQEGYAEAILQQQRMVARELQEGVGQDLIGLGFLSKSLSNRLLEPEKAELARNLTDGLEGALDQIRGLAQGMFPVELYSDGLMLALERLGSAMESVYKLRCRFECRKPVLVKNSQVALHLYRMAQEAATHAVKYRKSTDIRITLEELEGHIGLTISDNGGGTDEAVVRKEENGLRILRYRAAAIGADLRIDRTDGNGTRVNCLVLVAEDGSPHGGSTAIGA